MATTYESYNLILYGAQNLSLNKCVTSNVPGADEGYFEVQRMANARGEGSSVVNSRVAEKLITLTGTLKTPTGNSKTFQEIINEYKLALNKRDRYLRVSRKWVSVYVPDTTDGTWSESGDAEAGTAANDTSEYQLGTQSVSYDVDVSQGAVDIAQWNVAGFTSVDLSSVDETGNFEFWLYIPDVYYVSTMELWVGNDASNYWELDGIGTQYDGAEIENGWNYFSVPWSDMTETGTVDPSAIDFVLFNTRYSGDQGDDTGWRFGGLIWQDDDESRNWKAYTQNIRIDDEHFNVTASPFQFEFVASRGVSEATSPILEESTDDITAITNVTELDFGGTANPKPTIQYSLTDTTDWGNIVLSNLTTGQSLTFDESWSNGDTLIINEADYEVTLNGDAVDYANVLPVFVPGVNRLQTTITSASEESVTYEVQDSYFGDEYYYAQSFTTTSAGTLTEVQLYLKGVLMPSGTAGCFAQLYTDDAGDPDAISGFIGGFTCTSTSYTWLSSSCSVAVDAATKYWIVVFGLYSPGRGLGGGGETTQCYWGRDTAGGFAGQTLKYSLDTSSWTDTSDDADFRAYIQPASTIDYDIDVTYKKRYL